MQLSWLQRSGSKTFALRLFLGIKFQVSWLLQERGWLGFLQNYRATEKDPFTPSPHSKSLIRPPPPFVFKTSVLRLSYVRKWVQWLLNQILSPMTLRTLPFLLLDLTKHLSIDTKEPLNSFVLRFTGSTQMLRLRPVLSLCRR